VAQEKKSETGIMSKFYEGLLVSMCHEKVARGIVSCVLVIVVSPAGADVFRFCNKKVGIIHRVQDGRKIIGTIDWPRVVVSMHTARAKQLFCDLSAKALQAFEAIRCARAYHKGALLFMEGQSPLGIFMLCSGRVKLSSSTADGKRLIVKIAGPGDILGLPDTITSKPYQVSAEAIELCQVNFVRGEDFVRFVKEHSDFSLKLVEQLAEKYRAAWLGVSLRAQSVNARLANLLLEYRPKGRCSFGQEPRIDLPLSHEEIAERIGVTRETVSRAFSDLKKRGILRGRRSTWVVCSESALKDIAGSYYTEHIK